MPIRGFKGSEGGLQAYLAQIHLYSQAYQVFQVGTYYC